MKAMILAAGRGTRMRHLSTTTPKPLLSIGGESLISRHIRRLVEAGLNQIVINVSWLGEQIESAIGDGSQYGARVWYSREPEALETAGGIARALPLLDPEERDQPFIALNADVFTDYPFSQLKRFESSDSLRLGHLILVNNPPNHPHGDFHLDPMDCVRPQGTPRLTFSGIGVYRPQLFASMPSAVAPLAPLLKDAMVNSGITGEYYPGEWRDIGTPERLEELKSRLSARS